MFFHRAFPYELPEEFISVLDKDSKEHGIIRRISDFDEESAAIIRAELARKYFAPHITKINSLKERFGYLYWEVESDRGPLSFAIHDTFRSISKITESRVVLHRRRRQPLRDRRRARSRQQKLPQARAVPLTDPRQKQGRKGSVFPYVRYVANTVHPAEAARVSKEAGAEAVFVFAYNLTFDNAYTDGLAAIAGSADCASSPGFGAGEARRAGRRGIPLCAVGRLRVHRIRVGGAAAELLRTDMRHARAFQNAVMLLRALSEGRTVSAEPSVSAPAVRSAAGRFRAEAARSAPLRRPQKLLRRLWPFAKPSLKPLLVAVLLFSPSARSTC